MLELPVEEQEQMLLQLRAARDGVTGTLQSVISERKNRWLFIERWRVIEQACPDTQCVKSYVSRTTTGGTKAKAVALWLAQHPRFELVCVPGDCPRANPIERAFGDVPDKCTRNHKRTALAELAGEVKRHRRWNGPWRYRLSQLYYAPEVEAALAELQAAQELKAA